MQEYHVSVSQNPSGKGSPRMLYVSCWEQTVKALPRSLHSHPDFMEFTIVISGQGTCELDGLFYPIEKGDLIVCSPGVLHDEFVDSLPISVVSVAADRIQIPGMPDNCIIPEGVHPIFHLGSGASAFYSLTSLLTEQVKCKDPYSGLVSQSLFLALFFLVRNVIDQHRAVSDKAAPTSAKLGHQIRAYIDQHITEELSVEKIAQIFQISPSYLARIFKRSIGYPVSKYIIRRRLGEAQTLLLNSTMPISEVSLRVGYPNQSYFTKLFTQSFGFSPLQYRKMSRRQLFNFSSSQGSEQSALPRCYPDPPRR